MKRIAPWSETEGPNYIRGFRSIPYVALGTSRRGVYCAGLVVLFYKEHAIDIPDPATAVFFDAVQSAFARVWEKTPLSRYGDMVTMPGDQDFVQGHVGIWTPVGILHATSSQGVQCTPLHKTRFTGCYRYKEPQG